MGAKNSTSCSRRNFLRLCGLGVTAGAIGSAGCGHEAVGGRGWLPAQYRQPATALAALRGRVSLEEDDPALCRDDRKCILCGQCLQVCRDAQSVYGQYELPVRDAAICVHCGQCALFCPTGAIREKDDTKRVQEALADKNRQTVLQLAPATRVSLGEAFGLAPGSITAQQHVAAWRQCGATAVFDTAFAADVTVWEEAAEFQQRWEKGSLPHFTSCCPAWVKFCEYFYPQWLPRLSTVKSPQQILGTLLKSEYGQKYGLRANDVFSVAVMPCTAKKFECLRQKEAAGMQAVDAVLTVREAAALFQRQGVAIPVLAPSEFDAPFGVASGGGRIFGARGGVSEAVVRSLWLQRAGGALPSAALQWRQREDLKGLREAELALPEGRTLRLAAAQGLGQARAMMEALQSGQGSWDFIEVMACPGGCVGGGGQPLSQLPPTEEGRQARVAAMRAQDRQDLRSSHESRDARNVYESFLGEPCGEKAEALLHTSFQDRQQAFAAKAQPERRL